MYDYECSESENVHRYEELFNSMRNNSEKKVKVFTQMRKSCEK